VSVQTEDTGRETAYERGLRHGGTSTSGGGTSSFLKRQIGPLPVWVWLALILFGAVGYYLWSKKKAASTTSSASSSDTSTGTTDSNLIPQFVNQVYTNPAPPEGAGSASSTTSGTGGNASTTKSVSTSNYSWTDTGQLWTVAQLAQHLGVSVGSLVPTNTAGADALAAYKSNPKTTKLVPKGGKFDYTKEPETVTTTT
jgi:hypothetical protein